LILGSITLRFLHLEFETAPLEDKQILPKFRSVAMCRPTERGSEQGSALSDQMLFD
jgi:hypothetical protein